MQEQSARVFPATMPSVEVIGPVADVDMFLADHHHRPTDGAVEDQFGHFFYALPIAGVLCYPQLPAIGLGCGYHPVARLDGGGHGFFADHVLAGFEGLHGDVLMRAVASNDDQSVKLDLAEHGRQVRERAHVGVQLLFGDLHAVRVGVADGDQLGMVGKGRQPLSRTTQNPLAERSHTAIAQTNYREPLLNGNRHQKNSHSTAGLPRQCYFVSALAGTTFWASA